MASKHYVEVSDTVWAELVRIQKVFRVDKHALVDDIIAEAGDLEAVAERHQEQGVAKQLERALKPKDNQPALPLDDDFSDLI